MAADIMDEAHKAITTPKGAKTPKTATASIRLRPLRPEDLPALMDLYDQAYAEHPEYGESSRQKTCRYLKWLMRHHTFFQVAEAEGRPVGFIVVDADWRDWNGQPVGEIHELAVHPDYWGKSVATRLLQAGLEHIRARGRGLAGLWVGEHNDRAIAFYQRHGFRPVSWGYWVRMVKRL